MIEILPDLNLFAIILAYLISLALSYGWYSEYFFGELRKKILAIKFDQEVRSFDLKSLITIINFFTTIILAILINYSLVENLLDGLFLGLVLSFLILLAQLGYVFNNSFNLLDQKIKLLALDFALNLTSFLIQSIILSFWK